MNLQSSIRRLRALSVLLALTLVITEVALRVIFETPSFRFTATKLSGYIGDANVNDVKQRLRLRLLLLEADSSGEGLPPMFHPRLGLTAVARSEDNPFGIMTENSYLEDDRDLVLFFGDSFVEGYTEMSDKIPQTLDGRLEEFLVLNFGVRGYGLDQMYLYFLWAIEDLAPKHVLIGLLYADLNRLLFRVNQSPKPYFENENGILVLRGVPIPDDYHQWLDMYPPKVKSYLLAISRGLLRRSLATRWATRNFYSYHPSQSKKRRSEKMFIARRLTEEIRDECRRRGIELTFVLFPHTHHLIHEGWEEIFMRDLLRDLDIDFVDLEIPMKKYMVANGLVWWKDIYTLQAHPNRKENQVMADYIYEHLCANFEYLASSCTIRRTDGNLSRAP